MAGSMLIATIALNPAVYDMKAKAASSSYSEVSQTEYKVQRGDSLSRIAKKFGTTVKALMELNNLTSTKIFAGETLRIPTTVHHDEIEPPTTIKDVPSAPDLTTYTVVSGDSLSVIANRFQTTVDEIKNINNLTSNTIYVGQILKIPAQPSPLDHATKQDEKTTEPFTYVVTRGDVLSRIARRFNTTVNEIKEFNQLRSDTIYVGQKLKIPETATDPAPSPTEKESEQQTDRESVQTTTYTVVKGDSLYKIAKRFNTTISAIKEANMLQSDTIFVGQQLQIPTSEEQIVEQDSVAPSAPILHLLDPIHFSNQNHYVVSGKAECHCAINGH